MSKGGRPSIFSEALLDELCKRLSESTRPLAAVCRDEDMPCNATVWTWCRDMPGVAERVARARELGEENMAAEVIAIADDSLNDYTVIDEKGNKALDREHVQRSKLRVDARLRILEKMNPNRWGARVNAQVTGAGGGPVQHIVSTMTPQEAAEAYAATVLANADR